MFQTHLLLPLGYKRIVEIYLKGNGKKSVNELFEWCFLFADKIRNDSNLIDFYAAICVIDLHLGPLRIDPLIETKGEKKNEDIDGIDTLVHGYLIALLAFLYRFDYPNSTKLIFDTEIEVFSFFHTFLNIRHVHEYHLLSAIQMIDK